jgi:hypothetical protein
MKPGDEPVAWVLNLDAEDELARSGAHTPTAAMTARIEGLVARLSGERGLIRPGDQLLWPRSQAEKTSHSVLPERSRGAQSPTDPSGDASSTPLGQNGAPALVKGSAWCPTRWALAQLERAGIEAPRTPGPEILRRVNHRRFAHELGQALPAAGFAGDAAQLAALLSARGALDDASLERCWLIKRPLGFAGRGRKKVRVGEISAADQSWLDASLRTGDGVQVEPWVTRELDCALHGWLEEDGRCTLGRTTVQVVDETGAWQSTVLANPGDLTLTEETSLHTAAQHTAEALHAAGYFGPFGLDAFRWRDAGGAVHFQPRSELNARYSMGWAMGLRGA